MALAVLVPSALSAMELARSFNAEHPTEPAAEVAGHAVDRLGEGMVRALAVEMLSDLVEQVRRADVRVIEKVATHPAVVSSLSRTEAKFQRIADIAARVEIDNQIRLDLPARLLAAKFRVNGEWVMWQDATVAQHRARIADLASQVAGMQDTIARHQEAIRMILAAGKETLRDVARAR